jgi:hypothetical protein
MVPFRSLYHVLLRIVLCGDRQHDREHIATVATRVYSDGDSSDKLRGRRIRIKGQSTCAHGRHRI